MDTAASIGFQHWHLLLLVSVYLTHAQNSFYHLRTVVTHASFGLLADGAFLVLSNMPTTDLIRIVDKCDDPLSRLHTWHHHVGILYQSIIESINRGM